MRFQEWYKKHEAWIATCVLAIGSFALGTVISIGFTEAQCSKQIEEMRIVYSDVILQKNKMIDRLASSSVTATEKAAQAATAAKTAVQKVTNSAHDDKNSRH